MTTALRAALAFALLNALLTFENRWPGFGVVASPRLSFELCLALAALAAWVGWRGVPGRRAAAALAAAVVAAVVVRYADVTAPALLGRPVHVVWDGRHAAELLRLATRDWPAWQLAAAAVALALGVVGVALLAQAAWLALARALQPPAARAGVFAAVAVLGASFAAYEPGGRDTRWFFALPLTPTIVDQGLLVARLLGPGPGDAVLGPGPDFDGGLAGLERPAWPAAAALQGRRAGAARDAATAGAQTDAARPAAAGARLPVADHGPRRADVLLLFAESYGAVADDDPALAAALAPARERLAQAAAARGQGVVSARVVSPTFGGASWLAHAALLAGVDTSDPGHHALLLASERPTLVSHFARHGWRTVGWMPGLKKPWPEGAFYGFDRLADDAGIGYAGPDFGYWRIPDQAAMALLHAQELAAEPDDAADAADAIDAADTADTAEPVGSAGRTVRTGRAPRFIVFPTTSTHAPFHPLAPVVDDWARLLGPAAYDAATAAEAARAPQGDARARYLDSLHYQFDWLADYLRRLAPPGLVLVLVGDHQPPALVAAGRPSASAAGRRAPGTGAADGGWDVPVHVFSDDAALLRRLQDEGFVPGLHASGAAIGPMHALTGVLLRAFDAPAQAVAASGAGVPSVPAVQPRAGAAAQAGVAAVAVAGPDVRSAAGPLTAAGTSQACTSPDDASAGQVRSQSRIASASRPSGCSSRSRSPSETA
jgi:hypothetical protein